MVNPVYTFREFVCLIQKYLRDNRSFDLETVANYIYTKYQPSINHEDKTESIRLFVKLYTEQVINIDIFPALGEMVIFELVNSHVVDIVRIIFKPYNINNMLTQPLYIDAKTRGKELIKGICLVDTKLVFVK